ncbi:MAG: murein biosynthesis integral membrane protein MurJ [Nitrospiraceae bacterium]|nr:murein biosynthesis integral membrane protein MurJ [Nitrospiraceae bacterium]
MSGKHRIARAAGVMSIATLISRLLGFARDMTIAFYLGATGLSDAFYVSFRIPNLLRELFAEGSMSSGLIPILSEYHMKESPEKARELTRVVFTFLLFVVGGISVLGIIFAPAIIGLIAPGFLGNPEKFHLTVMLTRIMFPFLLFVSLSALLMGALNTRGVFFIPALAPAVLNVVMIVVVISIASYSPAIAAAVGVALGGLVQFAFQIPSYMRAGYDLKLAPEFRHPGLVKIGRLVLPATLAMAVSQINVVVSNILASFLPSGSITYLFYSMRLIHFPIGVFGVAMGLAVLPALSQHALKEDYESLRHDFSFALRVLFFLSLPSMAGLIALRVPIVSTLFLRGRFDYAATAGTAGALLFYAPGIWAMVGVRVLTSTFYAMQDTRRPVKSAIIALLVNLALSAALMYPMKHEGLALANAIASIVNFSVLFYYLRRKIARVDGRRILRSVSKTGFASLVMGIAGYMVLRSDIWDKPGLSAQKAVRLAGGISLSIGIYILLCYLLKSEELAFMLDAFKRRFFKKANAV